MQIYFLVSSFLFLINVEILAFTVPLISSYHSIRILNDTVLVL